MQLSIGSGSNQPQCVLVIVGAGGGLVGIFGCTSGYRGFFHPLVLFSTTTLAHSQLGLASARFVSYLLTSVANSTSARSGPRIGKQSSLPQVKLSAALASRTCLG